MRSGFRLAVRVLTGIALTAAVGMSSAQTPAQMEYERQQREDWRKQEEKRMEEFRLQQMQENARRQQDETNRAMRALVPKGSDDSTPGRGASATPRSSSGGDGAALCKAHPVRAGVRNPLVGGQWQPVNAASGDAFTQLFQMATLGVCAAFQAGIEFRERTHVTAIGEFPIQYGHKGDVWFACFPDTTFAFRVDNANQISVAGVDPPCRLRREGAARVAEAASARPAPAATAAAAVSSGAAGGGAAVLAFVATAAAPSGASAPAAGSSFFVLKNSVESVMAQAGIQPANGSRLKAWSVACGSGAPGCRQGIDALTQASVAVSKTDGGGRARMQLAPGTYYLVGMTPPTTPPLIWNVKVNLKPGDNLHILDRSNAASLN